MKLYETQGYYGSGHTACTVLCAETAGGTWYCVEGSKNVNFTYEDVGLGVDVELLPDCDTFTAGESIESLDQLELAIEG